MTKNIKLYTTLLLGASILFLSQCKKDNPSTGNTNTQIGTPAPLTKPAGFPPFQIPADNPQTEEGVELGRHLFYDKKLSADLSMSCSSCHLQYKAFSDLTPTSEGVEGLHGRRQAMVLFNLAFQNEFFWDGRVVGLEEQSLHPIKDPLELNTDLATVIARLEADPDYPDMFKAAFGDKNITEDRLGKAIAQFERTMISANSEFDRVKRISGNIDALFEEDTNTIGSKNNGYQIFATERGDCFHCHSVNVDGAYMGGGFGADGRFLNNGLNFEFSEDEGRKEVTNKDSDLGKFKVPSVRNVTFSAPFMHDGSIPDLDSIIGFYNFGGYLTPYTDPNMKFAGDAKGTRNFTKQEIEDLKEFLGTLTDYEFLEDPKFANPFEE